MLRARALLRQGNAAAVTASLQRAVIAAAGASRASSSSGSVVDKPIIPDKVVKHPYITGNYRYLPGFSFPAPRKLEQIVKHALLERESPARIREIWNEYHDDRLDAGMGGQREHDHHDELPRT